MTTRCDEPTDSQDTLNSLRSSSTTGTTGASVVRPETAPSSYGGQSRHRACLPISWSAVRQRWAYISTQSKSEEDVATTLAYRVGHQSEMKKVGELGKSSSVVG
jgi:hypothetical protein